MVSGAPFLAGWQHGGVGLQGQGAPRLGSGIASQVAKRVAWRAWSVRRQGELGAREGGAAGSRWGTTLPPTRPGRRRHADSGRQGQPHQVRLGDHPKCPKHQSTLRGLATTAAYRRPTAICGGGASLPLRAAPTPRASSTQCAAACSLPGAPGKATAGDPERRGGRYPEACRRTGQSPAQIQGQFQGLFLPAHGSVEDPAAGERRELVIQGGCASGSDSQRGHLRKASLPPFAGHLCLAPPFPSSHSTLLLNQHCFSFYIPQVFPHTGNEESSEDNIRNV